MKNFFRLHDYSENMKGKITIFSLKGKENIWWKGVKCVRGIKVEELSWHEFERLFRKKYLSKRYYGRKAKELYDLKMGSMTNEEYTSIFLELLRYVPCLKEDTAKILKFISGLSIVFKDRIEFDEPRSLEEAIKKLKHCYEESECRYETKKYWKGNEKNKGK